MTGFEPATSLATDGISLTRMPFGIVSCLLSALYHLNYTAPFSIPCFMKIKQVRIIQRVVSSRHHFISLVSFLDISAACSI